MQNIIPSMASCKSNVAFCKYQRILEINVKALIALLWLCHVRLDVVVLLDEQNVDIWLCCPAAYAPSNEWEWRCSAEKLGDAEQRESWLPPLLMGIRKQEWVVETKGAGATLKSPRMRCGTRKCWCGLEFSCVSSFSFPGLRFYLALYENEHIITNYQRYVHVPVHTYHIHMQRKRKEMEREREREPSGASTIGRHII